tara:strand:- start:1839 stop:2297 length:459 start_codon:yes stop_codon:yes gene_type:complete
MDNPIAFDSSRSLAALEDEDWTFSVDEYDAPSHAAALATKPVGKLNPGELLQLLQWKVSPRFTIPAAIARLMSDPFQKAALHEGDLMVAVLESDTAYWRDNYDLWCVMVDLLAQAITTVSARVEAEEAGDYLPHFLGDDFMAAVMHFRDIHG